MQNNRRSQPLALTAYRGRGIGEIKLYRNHAAVFTGPRSSTVTYINDTRLLFPLVTPDTHSLSSSSSVSKPCSAL